MKKIMSFVLVGILLFSGFGAGGLSNYESLENEISCFTADKESISVTIHVEQYEIKNIEDRQEIFVNDFGRLSTPGEPNIPSKIFAIAIPPGAKMVDVVYDAGEGVIIPGTYDISPALLPQVMDGENPFPSRMDIDMFEETFNSIYNSDDLYPAEVVEFVRTAKYRKYDLIDVRVTPITYRPLSGQFVYHPEITVYVKYSVPEKEYEVMVDHTIRSEQIAKEIIVNYDQAQNWYPMNNVASKGVHDFVIITLDSLESVVTSLVNWETEKGRTVKVVTISWIDSNYEGYDLAEKMRNFLREKYPTEEWGIEDVLIVGHWDDVPMRRTWQSMGGSTDERPETDFYYAELSKPDNESWDVDSDHKYGENSDPIDFYAEVNVGRIPWSDFETVQHICEKSVAYEQNNDPSFKNNILLLAAFIDDNTDGATFMEYTVNSSIHPWMAHWMKTRLYDRDSSYPKDYVLNHLNVLSVWSQGKFAFVSWHAHGNPYGSGNFISVDDCQYLNDNYPAIISAASCSNSDTDYLNIGQAMMKQGAVGFLGANKATPYRSEWDDPNDGSDQSFKYFFISSVTSGEYTQGQAHQHAIREMYSRGLWYQLKYETFVHGSLWGNPDLGMASVNENDPPETPSRPNGPTSGKIHREHTFTTSTTDPDGNDIYYLFDWGDGSDSGWIGPYLSGENAEASYTWTEQGNYEIKVIAQDINGAMSEWSDPLVVSMPKNKQSINPVSLRVLENHLRMFPLLRFLFKLNGGI